MFNSLKWTCLAIFLLQSPLHELKPTSAVAATEKLRDMQISGDVTLGVGSCNLQLVPQQNSEASCKKNCLQHRNRSFDSRTSTRTIFFQKRKIACAWTSVILAGKRDSRHHFTTSFWKNGEAANTSPRSVGDQDKYCDSLNHPLAGLYLYSKTKHWRATNVHIYMRSDENG